MGCVLSNMDEEEKVRICKERKRLMKQLVDIRGEFSDSQLAYLTALKNTGATLRQLTDSDSLELFENSSDRIGLARPPPPPLPLPPSPLQPPPPPPPPLSPDKNTGKVTQNESFEDENNVHSSLSPFGEYFNLFRPSPPYHNGFEIAESEPEENWAETNTEFEDEEAEVAAVASGGVDPLSKKEHCREQVDDSCAKSLRTKESRDLPRVVGKRKKSLEGIIKELDECFLKASAGTKEIAVFIDIRGGNQESGHQNKKRSNSAKVFNVLSWSRHSKSSQYTRDDSAPSGPCRPGAHCVTLKKLYDAEKRLSKLLKEEEITKVEYERKSLLLQKQEDENIDMIKIEKTQSSVENLESDVIRLRQAISETTSSILKLIDEELYPQLVALTSGLTHMWRTMYECHQAQTIISQQLSHLSDNQSTMLNSENQHQATLQLAAEVNCWYDSFCKLVKSQREYVKILCKWVQLTDCLMDEHERSGCASMIRSISEQWDLGLGKLPDKEASEAIRSLWLSIRCIIDRQAEEDNLLKKVGKLNRRMQKELNSLAEMEENIKWSFDAGDIPVNMSPTHPLTVKRAKTEALKKQVESEEAKLLSSVQANKVMTLTNLKTRLPQVFQSLSSFSSVYVQAIEGVHSQVKTAELSDTASSN